ncbi:TRAP transporter large permease [Sporosarcina pasteurii]|uniref:Neu5Ac permease n=1 Tax=Sporosarcina pasteurii TaxID=1474 RepID=A0A380BFG7_SPOPA|nr:TRAP transporter large permease [Sporosarcina pasteurii]MDS9472551.1 TRAP transporter large permease [Sporosarcina pasteurii]QBQ06104.1 TRAP transporter large permease [Sporosarcina pasteurii]SUI99430.1 Neu5Ac permease [Sporosarcina pasteurii]
MNIFFAGGMGALLLLGLPVAFTLGLLAIAGMYFFNGGTTAFMQIPIISYKSLDDFSLTALPMYVLMSQVLVVSGVGRDLYEMASRWFRHFPGGLAIATIFCCTIFSAISGSSVATAVTVGAVALPEMVKRGYNRRHVLGLLAAGGTLGILIPPSIPMIIYGSVTGESVGKLFVAGIIPGIVLTLSFMIFSAYQTRHIKDIPATWKERVEASRQAIWGLLLPIIIIGGIYTGIFTPTEAAAIGVVLSFAIAAFVYRNLTLPNLKNIIFQTVKTNTMILFIIIGAMLLGFILTILQIPQTIVNVATTQDISPWVIFILINIVLLILGMFLETVSILVITLPILYPIIIALGFDPIWFAIIMVINMELALISPPVGLNLFVLKGLNKENTISEIVKGVVPYAVIMLVFMVILSFFPQIATVLVDNVK